MNAHGSPAWRVGRDSGGDRLVLSGDGLELVAHVGFQVDSGSPVQEGAGAQAVGPGGRYVSVASSGGVQVDGAVGELLGEVDDLVEGGVGAAADVDRSPGARFDGGGDGGGDDVVDEGEVAALVAVPVQPQGLSSDGGVQGAVDENMSGRWRGP